MPTTTFDKVALHLATELGQPVFGTSKGSTYICCAIHQHFNVAIRNKSGGISMRVEPNHSEHLGDLAITNMKQLGFGGDSTTYLSQHFETQGGPLSGCAAYGAIIEQIKYLFGEGIVGILDWKQVANLGN